MAGLAACAHLDACTNLDGKDALWAHYCSSQENFLCRCSIVLSLMPIISDVAAAKANEEGNVPVKGVGIYKLATEKERLCFGANGCVISQGAAI